MQKHSFRAVSSLLLSILFTYHFVAIFSQMSSFAKATIIKITA